VLHCNIPNSIEYPLAPHARGTEAPAYGFGYGFLGEFNGQAGQVADLASMR